MPKRFQIKYWLFLLPLFLFSCENEMESEKITYTCYGNLAAPEITLVGTNDFGFTDGGVNGSTYYFTLEFDSECMLDDYSELLLTMELYSDDFLDKVLYIKYDKTSLNQNGNRINGGLGIRYSISNKAKLIFKMSNLIGNEVSLVLDKHDGAN